MSKSTYSINPYKWYGIQSVPKIDKDGEIYFNIYAYKKVRNVYKKKLLIMKISENEKKCQIRGGNIEFNSCSGYVIRFPGDKGRYMGDVYEKYPTFKVKADKLPDIPSYFAGDLSVIEKLDPSLKYLVKALSEQNQAISIDIIKSYRKYPLDVELLIKTKCPNILHTKKAFTLKPDLKKKMYRKIKEGAPEDFKLRDVLRAIKFDVSIEMAIKLDQYIVKGIKDFKRLSNYAPSVDENFYKDYLVMAKKANKDLSDPYWAFPKNLKERHDKLVEELRNEQLAKLRVEDEQLMNVSRKLRRRYKPASINGYSIDFPKNMEDLIVQAETLHQCLISAGYYKRFIKRGVILVLIKKDSEPVATVEIKDDKTIGQFYGDQRNEQRRLPSSEIKNAFDEWYKNFFLSNQKGAQA